MHQFRKNPSKPEFCTGESLTGNVPGKDASKNETRELGGAEKRTGEPENSLVLELIWA